MTEMFWRTAGGDYWKLLEKHVIGEWQVRLMVLDRVHNRRWRVRTGPPTRGAYFQNSNYKTERSARMSLEQQLRRAAVGNAEQVLLGVKK